MGVFFDKRAADALADEVAVLVRVGTIDARSPAGDALLDYRNDEAPFTERSERIAELTERASMLESSLGAVRASLDSTLTDLQSLQRERDYWKERCDDHAANRNRDLAAYAVTLKERDEDRAARKRAEAACAAKDEAMVAAVEYVDAARVHLETPRYKPTDGMALVRLVEIRGQRAWDSKCRWLKLRNSAFAIDCGKAIADELAALREVEQAAGSYLNTVGADGMTEADNQERARRLSALNRALAAAEKVRRGS